MCVFSPRLFLIHNCYLKVVDIFWLYSILILMIKWVKLNTFHVIYGHFFLFTIRICDYLNVHLGFFLVGCFFFCFFLKQHIQRSACSLIMFSSVSPYRIIFIICDQLLYISVIMVKNGTCLFPRAFVIVRSVVEMAGRAYVWCT